MSEWEAIKEYKVSIGAVISFAIFVLLAYGPVKNWHFDNFVSSVQAAETGLIITTQLDKIEKTQTDHIKEYAIDQALERVSRLENKLYYMGRDLGDNPERDERYNELATDLRHAEEYKLCLLRERLNCEHLNRR